MDPTQNNPFGFGITSSNPQPDNGTQPEVAQPVTVQPVAQSVTTQPAAVQPAYPSATAQPTTAYQPVKKAWPLATAWTAYGISAALFLAIGPGSIIMAFLTSPYAWLVSFWWIPQIWTLLLWLSPVILVLGILSIVFAAKEFPTKMATILPITITPLVGYIITALALYGPLHMSMYLYAIVSAAIVIIPAIIVIVAKSKSNRLR